MGSDLPKDANAEFAFETDSLAVAYSFSASNGLLTMGVFNTSSKPIFVNWAQSALVINRQSVSMNQYKGLETEFIPPGAMTVFEAPINQFFIDKFHALPNVQRGKLLFNKFPQEYLYRDFQRLQSTLQVRTHLNLANNAAFQTPLVIDHNFWLEKILEFRSEEVKNAYVVHSSGPHKGKPMAECFQMENQLEGTISPAGCFVYTALLAAILYALLENSAIE